MLFRSGHFFHNIKIVTPQELPGEKIFVLIAIKDRQEEIKEQLKELGKSSIRCAGLNDLMNAYYQKIKSMKGNR